MNEVDIGLGLCPGMAAVVRTKLTPAAFRDSVLTAKRYSAPDGVKVGYTHDCDKELVGHL